MDDRINAIRDGIAVNFDETTALLKRLSADDLKKRAANGWTIAQLAGHVAVSPSTMIYVLSRLQRGGNATVPSFLSWAPAVRNWFIVRKYNSATAEDMLKTTEEARDELLAWVDNTKPEDLDRAGEVFGIGRKTVAESLHYILEHGREHRAEITAALA